MPINKTFYLKFIIINRYYNQIHLTDGHNYNIINIIYTSTYLYNINIILKTINGLELSSILSIHRVL